MKVMMRPALAAMVVSIIQEASGFGLAGSAGVSPAKTSWCGGVVSCASSRRGNALVTRMAERELTNEECDILNLPRGTKLVDEMSER